MIHATEQDLATRHRVAPLIPADRDNDGQVTAERRTRHDDAVEFPTRAVNGAASPGLT